MVCGVCGEKFGKQPGPGRKGFGWWGVVVVCVYRLLRFFYVLKTPLNFSVYSLSFSVFFLFFFFCKGLFSFLGFCFFPIYFFL